MRTLLTCLMLSSFAIAQAGIGGKAGMGGKAGVGAGVAAGTTVTYASINGIGNGAGAITLSSTPTAGSAVAINIMNFNIGQTLTAVSDGGSTYTIETTYVNTGHFTSTTAYTCNFQGTGATLTFTGVTGVYSTAVVAIGNRTTGCIDGYVTNQSIAGSTAWTTVPNTITTTNARDMLVCFGSSNSASGLVWGVDGQGNTFTNLGNAADADFMATINETATSTYSCSGVGTSAPWNMELLAIR